MLAVAGNETEAVVTNLRANRTYHFRVQARNSQGYGPASASVQQYTSETQLGESLHVVVWDILGRTLSN